MIRATIGRTRRRAAPGGSRPIRGRVSTRAAVMRHLRTRRLWAAYQAFVAACDRARRHADADHELDDESEE